MIASLLSFFVIPPQTVIAKPLDQFKMVLGDWWGTGWQGSETNKTMFDSHETVESRGNGSAYVITGLHWVDSVNQDRKVVYDAVGLIWFDSVEKKYWLQNHVDTSPVQKYEIFPIANGFRWKIGLAIDVSLKIEDGMWIEEAFRERDGKKEKIFEIKMSKKP